MEFPEEIWTGIFSHLIPQKPDAFIFTAEEINFPYKNLRALSLVSHKFRRLAQPILHRNVFVVQCTNDPPRQREMKLLRTLFRSPSLARAVRSLSLASFCISENDPEFPDKEIFLEVFQSLDIPSLLKGQLDIKSFFQRGVDGVPVLLALTAAVQHVDVTISEWHWHERISHQLAGSMQPDEPDPPRNYSNYGLADLKHISITAESSPRNTYISYVEPVLKRSDLTSLRLANVNWHSNWVGAIPRPSQICNLHSLTLDDCVVDEVTLKDILTRYPKLRRLSLTCSESRSAINPDEYDWSGDEAPWYWRSGPFGDVLREHGRHLEEFALLTDHHRAFTYSWVTNYDETLLGSFHDLLSLRRMEVSLRELFGRKDKDRKVNIDISLFPANLEVDTGLLPPNIEEIVIPDRECVYLGEALALIRGRSLTKLRRVTLGFAGGRLWDLKDIPDDEIPGWTYLERDLLDTRPVKVFFLHFVKLPIETSLL
ncbi:unnamed protein product [Clonostachys rosea]|uniref:F-box domain-containing protein n=1 Tax=Bionectria ochroleuca TaxID=29856 RepID=A0ABY6U583_BIOOC|nr:unnamed protein product [Clonostachys rosea]